MGDPVKPRKVFYISLAVPVLLELFWLKPHAHGAWWHGVAGSHAMIGIAISAALIVVSKILSNTLLGLPTDYYEKREDSDGA